MARILIVTPNELTRDVQARWQVAAALAAGHSVVGLSGRSPLDTELPLPDIEVVRVPAERLSRTLRRQGLGGPTRSKPVVRELRGIYRLLRLVRITAWLTFAGLRLGRVDIVHANQLDALPAGCLLALRYRARLVYDAHELYMFIEEDPPRIYRAIVGPIESALARRAQAVTSTCEPYAEFLTRHFKLARPALAVVNAPARRDDLPEVVSGNGRLRVVYQAGPDQPSRPVSDTVLAAEQAPNVDLTIRVVRFDRESIERMIADRGLTERVRIADHVPETELVDALTPFEVGIILLRPVNVDSKLSQPNKLFEYMMAGLAVVAPDLPGMAPVVNGGAIGLTYAPDRPDELAAALEQLAADRPHLLEMRKRGRALALSRFNAEAQRPVLEEAWGAVVSS